MARVAATDAGAVMTVISRTSATATAVTALTGHITAVTNAATVIIGPEAAAIEAVFTIGLTARVTTDRIFTDSAFHLTITGDIAKGTAITISKDRSHGVRISRSMAIADGNTLVKVTVITSLNSTTAREGTATSSRTIASNAVITATTAIGRAAIATNRRAVRRDLRPIVPIASFAASSPMITDAVGTATGSPTNWEASLMPNRLSRSMGHLTGPAIGQDAAITCPTTTAAQAATATPSRMRLTIMTANGHRGAEEADTTADCARRRVGRGPIATHPISTT